MLRIPSIATARGRSVAARQTLVLATGEDGAPATLVLRAPLPVDHEQARAAHAVEVQAIINGSHALAAAGLFEVVPVDVSTMTGLAGMLYAARLAAICTLEHAEFEVDGVALRADPADPGPFAAGLFRIMYALPDACSAICDWAMAPHRLEAAEGNGLPPASSPAGGPVQAGSTAPASPDPSTGTVA